MRLPPGVSLLAFALTTLACGGSAPRSETQRERPRTVGEGAPGVLTDIDDRCHLLEDCFTDGFYVDTDGCPDPSIAFEIHSASLDAHAASLLEEVATETQHLSGLELRIIGTATSAESEDLGQIRADAVRAWLAEHHANARLEAVGEVGPHPAVHFEPTRCSAD